jgi:hypothetical protein
MIYNDYFNAFLSFLGRIAEHRSAFEGKAELLSLNNEIRK